MRYAALPSTFYDRPPAIIARDLLGQYIVRDHNGELLVALITETEAYLPEEDPASHSFRGKTKRNASMYKSAGHAYVYSMHRQNLLNVVTEAADRPGAVLIRAIVPIEGKETMEKLRGKNTYDGPGKLCQALGITRELDGVDITVQEAPLFFANNPERANIGDIRTSGRIGISRAQDLELRFVLHSHYTQ